jgi:hypothetical protein
VVEPLKYGTAFELTAEEKEQVRIFDEFPETAARRLGEDEKQQAGVGAVRHGHVPRR